MRRNAATKRRWPNGCATTAVWRARTRRLSIPVSALTRTRPKSNTASTWCATKSPGAWPKATTERNCSIGKCLYDPIEQRRLIEQVVDAVVNLADERGERDDLAARQPSRTYYPVFELVESDLLRIAALLKHPSFQEEEEWRIVSPVITDYLRSPVLFREGASMLVPYFEFKLTAGSGEPIPLEHLFLGPTLNINLSMDSLKLYLAKQGINPRQGISYCQIPYRQW